MFKLKEMIVANVSKSGRQLVKHRCVGRAYQVHLVFGIGCNFCLDHVDLVQNELDFHRQAEAAKPYILLDRTFEVEAAEELNADLGEQ